MQCSKRDLGSFTLQPFGKLVFMPGRVQCWPPFLVLSSWRVCSWFTPLPFPLSLISLGRVVASSPDGVRALSAWSDVPRRCRTPRGGGSATGKAVVCVHGNRRVSAARARGLCRLKDNDKATKRCISICPLFPFWIHSCAERTWEVDAVLVNV